MLLYMFRMLHAINIHLAGQACPTKRKTKATGKHTGGRPTTKPQNRGMTLETEVSTEKEKTTTGDVESSQDDNQSTTSSEDVAPSPKRQNQKTTPPAAEPSRRSTRNRQSALSNAFGNAIPINTIIEPRNIEKESRQFQIDLPPEQEKSNLPSLKTLIKEMGFSDETPQYQTCLKFIEAISPKQAKKKDEAVDLTSLTDEMAANNNDILLFKGGKTQKTDADAEMPDDEEHTRQEDEMTKEVKEAN